MWLADRLYGELACFYESIGRILSLGRLPAWRRETLQHIKGRRVLEIGIGSGELLLEIAGLQLNAFGLERSTAMLQVTAANLARQGMQLPCVQATAQSMPFIDGCFDSIVSTFPAEFIFDPATLFEVSRLLCKPDSSTGQAGGRFIVAGFCVYAESGPLRRAVKQLFGMQLEQLIEKYEKMAATVGLRTFVAPAGGKHLRIPVIIAEKT